MLEKKVTIDKLIKNAQKDEYFKDLEALGYSFTGYPSESTNENATSKKLEVPSEDSKSTTKTTPSKKKRYGYYLIPDHVQIEFDNGPEIVRMEKIVEELRRLPRKDFINACAVLFRVLVECATNYYNETHDVTQKSEKLHVTVKVALDHMTSHSRMNKKDAETLEKFAQQEEIISAHTFHGWVHSGSTSPSDHHLQAMWDSFAQYLCICAKAKSFLSNKHVAAE